MKKTLYLDCASGASGDMVLGALLDLGVSLDGLRAALAGLLPDGSVPAPATLRLLEGVPAYSSGVEMELLTPTGALLVTGYASAYGPLPAMRILRAGYGAGSKEIPGVPNVLRMVTGEDANTGDAMRVAVLECNIDDMNPQFFGAVMDQLYAAGALDVCYGPVQMKKNRPGTLVTIVAPPAKKDALLGVLFRETTTIGVRHHEADRTCLSREWVRVTTPYGPVRVKVARRDGIVVNAAPEYDDCVALAAQQGAPVKDVHAAAMSAYLQDRHRESRA
jgi:pyridinium-3,5-bisthiocarboxylic acid mononucleotide nickel chelatase